MAAQVSTIIRPFPYMSSNPTVFVPVRPMIPHAFIPTPVETPTFAKLKEFSFLNEKLNEFGETHLSKIGRASNKNLSLRYKVSMFSDGTDRLLAEMCCLIKHFGVFRNYVGYLISQGYQVQLVHVTGPIRDLDMWGFYAKIGAITGVDVDCYRLRIWSTPFTNVHEMTTHAEALYVKLVQAHLLFAKHLEI